MTERDEILDVLAHETGLSGPELSTDGSLIDLGLTSFTIMRILVALEEHLGVELSEGQMDELVSTPVSGLPALVRRAGPGAL
jgi:acyl carrier protein